MARARYTIEQSDDIRFIHRPLPAQGGDLILYVEDQITRLLFSGESLDDVVYRCMETDRGVLIAIARKTALAQKPVTAKTVAIRLPTAVSLWLRSRAALKPDATTLLLLSDGDRPWLLAADALQIHRVYRIEGDGALATALDALTRENGYPPALAHNGELSAAFGTVLDERSFSTVSLDLSSTPVMDRSVAEAWDFRLPMEASAQELHLWKSRTVKSGIFAAAGIALLWLLLYGGNAALERVEERTAGKWTALRSSLREIGYLQKETRNLIAEINLCRALADQRTNRAAVLQTLATSRPREVLLETVRIGEKKKRFVKGKASATAGEQLRLEGLSRDPRGITSWMDALQKSGAFASVNLLTMERKGADYRYQIECDLPAQ